LSQRTLKTANYLIMATRFHFLLLGVAAILLILALAHQHDQVIDTIKKPWSKGSGASTGSAR